MGRRAWLALPVALPAALLLAACGGNGERSESPSPQAASTSPASASSSAMPVPELIGRGVVLQEQDRRPVLCLGAVAESQPPQCAGPEISGWDWAAVSGEERAGGTTWGDYVVVGTYDGERFTTTRPAEPTATYDGPLPAAPEEPVRTTQCSQRDEGRRVVDGSKTTDADLRRTQRVAAGLEGFADTWLDESTTQDESKPSDPSQAVLNVRVTGDTDAASWKLRQTWGGRLCVSKALRSEEDLVAVRRELERRPDVQTLSSGFDQVDLAVIYDEDGELQRSLDEKYGVGVVVVTSLLRPVPDD